MVKRKFLRLFIIITAVTLFLDQLAKYFVMQVKPALIVIPGFFNITYTTNTGISFGLLTGKPAIPLLVSLGVIAWIVFYYDTLPQEKVPQIGIALLLAGALGNLTDRLIHGFVIDFIDILAWPAFNVADMGITIGAGLLIIFLLKKN